MRYLVPDVCVTAEAPPETKVQDKFGGLPFDLGAARISVKGRIFGDGGVADLFLHRAGGVPQACMFWQCL
jgi:hypothetical protein